MTESKRPDARPPDPRDLIGSDAESSRLPCSLVHDLMPAAVGGELEEETEAVLDRHVKECLPCAREWRSLIDSHLALRSLAEGGEADPGFDDDFFAELHEGIVGELRRQSQVQHDHRTLLSTGPRRRRAGALSWVPIVAALAATLLVGFLIGKVMDGFGPRPSTQNAHQAFSAADWQRIAEPEFTPYLVDAIRKFAERKTATHRLDALGAPVPVSDTGKTLGPHETDF